MPYIEMLTKHARLLIDLYVEQYERRPDDPAFHIGKIHGTWNMFYAAGLSLPVIPWDAVREMDRYAKDAVDWIRQRDKVRRYLNAA